MKEAVYGILPPTTVTSSQYFADCLQDLKLVYRRFAESLHSSSHTLNLDVYESCDLYSSFNFLAEIGSVKRGKDCFSNLKTPFE